jgi:hypothetical protein
VGKRRPCHTIFGLHWSRGRTNNCQAGETVSELAVGADTCPSGQVIRLDRAIWTGAGNTQRGVFSRLEGSGTGVASFMSHPDKLIHGRGFVGQAYSAVFVYRTTGSSEGREPSDSPSSLFPGFESSTRFAMLLTD